MSETQTYKEWLALGDSQSAVVDTVEIHHPSWPSTVHLTNWGTDLLCTIEDNGASYQQLFNRAAFSYERASVSDGTDQRTSISIAAYDGLIYDVLKDMSADDRMTPITVRPRMYLHSDLTKQLINPSPTWTLHSVNATFDTVTGELQVAPLRAHRTGRYFTALEFPVLVYAS